MVLKKLKCWRRGHHWVNVSFAPYGWAQMEYTDVCIHCNKKRTEVVQEH